MPNENLTKQPNWGANWVFKIIKQENQNAIPTCTPTNNNKCNND